MRIVSCLYFLTILTVGHALPFKENHRQNTSTPSAQILNGTVVGKYIEGFDQDAFLGIRYAQPPVGSKRFMNPVSLNSKFDGDTFEATEYSDACYDLGLFGDNKGLPRSEDCLTLNIVKPSTNATSLPVAVWIHGGGFSDGSSRRDVYNLSYIVQNGMEQGKPFIGVSINYRLGGFGFLKGDELLKLGNTNVGLRDQLKALEWLNENIAGFGGDPNHIVIWGESAGATSVGLHLISGKLGHFIKGAIMESGTARLPGIFGETMAEDNENVYQNISLYFNCTGNSSLSCLQGVNASHLNEVFSGKTKALTKSVNSFPFIDGDYIPYFPSIRMVDPAVIPDIPIIVGTNTEEGTAFSKIGLNTTSGVADAMRKQFPLLRNSSISKILELYPEGNGKVSGSNLTIPAYYGKQYSRISSIFGDIMMMAQARAIASDWANKLIEVYKYRWNVADKGVSPIVGATHFQEVVYVFDNPSDHFVTASPWNEDKSSSELAKLISSQWVSFFSTLNPNNHGIENVPVWDKYLKDQKNFVYELQGKSHLEDDNFREEAIDYIIDLGPQCGC